MPDATLQLMRSDEEKMLADAARKFVQQNAPVGRLREFRADSSGIGFERDIWQHMAELGWQGLIIPENYSGLGLGFSELCVVLEETGRALMPEPLLSTCALGASALLLAGNDAQKTKWLSLIANGKAIASIAWAEPGRGTDPFEINLLAKRKGSDHEISGEKNQVLAGSAADLLIIVTRTNEKAKGRDGLTLFLVESDRAGISIAPQSRIDVQSVAKIDFQNVKLVQADVLGKVDFAGGVLEALLERACIASAAEMLGGAEQAFSLTIQYLKDRVQFDRPIGRFQALQHRAARLYTELAITRSAVVAAARALDEKRAEASQYASLAKALASETFNHVAKEAIQMHGGIGMTDEHDIGFYLKRAQACSVLFGEASWHRARWASLSAY